MTMAMAMIIKDAYFLFGWLVGRVGRVGLRNWAKEGGRVWVVEVGLIDQCINGYYVIVGMPDV